MSDRIDATAVKYRHARAAIVVLKGEEGCGEFKALEVEDITAVHEVEKDTKATKCLGRVSGRESRAQARSSSQKLSWIWTVMGNDEMDEGVHECGCLFVFRRTVSC